MSTRAQILQTANRTLAVSALALLLSVLAAYPFAEHFSMGLQVTAHLAITVAAGFFKLGYVVRLAAQHDMALTQRA
ncbi:hypothetical protein [Inhella proteolytica]|uniref:Uncharacterized protein n=1 Tax=Inhella proteolytica TaxID=2795029 RepID=A0A931NFE3_9BURK|nr:hypothetical protein [Inhella proteolytica]MBH9578687.1 hypothetical protein [Inhella proteolytica]